MSPASDGGTVVAMTDVSGEHAAAPTAVYFDGTSNRRRNVGLTLADALEISEAGAAAVRWAYADIRQADGTPGMLRLSCLSAPALARLEIRDAAIAAALLSRCTRLGAANVDARGVAKIVGWSLAAAASIVGLVLFVIPLAADWLTPMVPQALERRLGDAAAVQVETLFSGKTCKDAAGQLPFTKLITTLRDAAGLDSQVAASVLQTSISNAFALPGGKVVLFSGLLAKANNPDEIAGVLAHELGHLKHRDSIRELIHNGGTSFLIGLLFGDITGSGAVIFASRSLVTASYSREAEEGADGFAIDVMHRLGRSPKPMGQLLLRVTGRQSGTIPSILSSHPLTEERLKRMSEEDRPPNGPPLLDDDEWAALKAICK
jgi:Zn-dependent protease with chaperone function